MPLPVLARFLDPRPSDVARERPIADSVNLPLSGLANRMHHLPPRHGEVAIAGPKPWASAAAEFLTASGRKASIASDWEYGNSYPGRLWEPNGFLFEVAGRLEPRSACDLACGTGRDAAALAGLGWHVTAIDHLPDAVELGRELASSYLDPAESGSIVWQVIDLESAFDLDRPFDLISMSWYLNRPLIQRALELLSVGGSVVVETFTSIHRERYGKPRTEEFVLRPGELESLAIGLEVMSFNEDWHGDRHSARLWARKP